MNSILIKNRQTENARGAGFPFYNFIEYQYRFQERSEHTPFGYFITPVNKFPSFQIWTEFDADTIELVKVSGTEDVSITTYDVSILDKVCVPGYKIYSTKNNEGLPFSIACGNYYLKIYDSANEVGRSCYSEVFSADGIFSPVLDLQLTLSSELVGSITSSHTIFFVSYVFDRPAGSGASVNLPAPYNINIPFSLNIGEFANITFTINTICLGAFVETYRVERGIRGLELTKIYL